MSFPNNVHCLKFKYKIYFVHANSGNIEFSDYYTNDCKQGKYNTERQKKKFRLPLEQFIGLKEVTICANIQITNEYDNAYNDNTSKYIAQKWCENQFIWQNNIFCITYEWIIFLERLKTFRYSTSSRILSDVLQVGNLRFGMEISKSNVDVSADVIELTLFTMPIDWRCVYISVMVECNLQKYFKIHKFDKISKKCVYICNESFLKRVLKEYSDLNNLVITITLLRIVKGVEKKKFILLYSIPFTSYKLQQRIKWKINDFIFKRIKTMND
eukprot:187771_1